METSTNEKKLLALKSHQYNRLQKQFKGIPNSQDVFPELMGVEIPAPPANVATQRKKLAQTDALVAPAASEPARSLSQRLTRYLTMGFFGLVMYLIALKISTRILQ
jgi:hypothetical protein